ncbi:hypothetical protein IOW38_004134 [Salmonella enterica]|nr:hypothetical protein [Salmonella enterica]EGM2645634.1 hypothetical protein [Salmonella enterica]EGM2983573.1 hypothetical protein [Salmonella enterica]
MVSNNTRKTLFILSGVMTLMLSFCGTASAGTDSEGAPEDVWHFTVSPAFGAMGFRGNGAVGPLSGHLKMPFHKVAKDTRFAMAGSVEADRGPLSLWLSGQYLDMSQDVALEGGYVKGHANAHATQMELGGAYRVWAQSTGGRTFHGGQQQMSLSPLAGVRWTRLKATFDADGMSASQRETWAIPFAGTRFSADLSPRWLLSAEADIGAWGRDFTLQSQVFAGYRLLLLGQPAVLRGGYQVLHQDHKTSDFHWDVTQFGPVAGLSVTF